jgi:hypothetical protein
VRYATTSVRGSSSGLAMPVGPLLCVIDGPTRGRPWASDAARGQLCRHRPRPQGTDDPASSRLRI